MQVTDVSTIRLRYTVATTLAAAFYSMPVRTVARVRIDTDSGLVGTGKSAAYGGSPESLGRVMLDDLRPSLVGEDPFAVARLWQRMAYRSQQRGPAGMLMQAISGVDIARWDLIGQATQTPLARRFGAYRDELEAYASAGFCAARATMPNGPR